MASEQKDTRGSTRRQFIRYWLQGHRDKEWLCEQLGIQERQLDNYIKELKDEHHQWFTNNPSLQKKQEEVMKEIADEIELVKATLWDLYESIPKHEAEEGITLDHIKLQIDTLTKILNVISEKKDVFGVKGSLLSEMDLTERIQQLKSQLERMKKKDKKENENTETQEVETQEVITNA